MEIVLISNNPHLVKGGGSVLRFEGKGSAIIKVHHKSQSSGHINTGIVSTCFDDVYRLNKNDLSLGSSTRSKIVVNGHQRPYLLFMP